MEKIVEQGLLYDFYGELLTDHQRHIYEDVVFNDMSLRCGWLKSHNLVTNL